MSSKRSMYKVVSTKQEKSGPNRRRKPLIQGRLVTTKDADSRPKVVDPLFQGEKVATVALSPREVKITTPRRHLGSRVKGDESYTSPRRDTPSVSLQHSPRPVAPSQSLELSDSEIEFNMKTNESGGFPPAQTEVMFVDASGHTQDANTSEVSISLAVAKSPVRVVCHTDSPVVSNVHGSGSVAQAAKVATDALPSFEIGSSDGHPAGRSSSYSPEENVIPARLRTGGSPGHHKSIVKSLFSGSAAEDSDGDSCVVIPTALTDLGDGSSPGSNDSSSVMADQSSVVATPAMKSKSLKSGSAKKRHKNAQVIPSRYMQAASKVASSAKGPLKATDRSIMERSKINRSDMSLLGPKRTGGSSFLAPKLTGGTQGRSTSLLLPKRTGEGARRTRGPGSAKKNRSSATAASSVKDAGRRAKHASGGAQFSTTPEAHGKGTQASTPTGEPPMHNVDVSAITVHSSIMSTPESLDMTHDLPGHSTPPRPDLSLESRTTQEKPVEVSLSHLEPLHSRYLQWVYLNYIAEKSFKEQERNAMSQMYGLWLENEKLRQRKFELQSQLSKLCHINQVDEALEMQSSGLKEVVAGLSQMQQQHNTLVAALDTTRHHIPTRGIHIPDEEDQYHDSLQHALGETEKLLGELSVMIRTQEPKVTNYANSISAVHKTVETEVKELSKCQELLSAASALTLQETSLMIQDSQIADD